VKNNLAAKKNNYVQDEYGLPAQSVQKSPMNPSEMNVKADSGPSANEDSDWSNRMDVNQMYSLNKLKDQ